MHAYSGVLSQRLTIYRNTGTGLAHTHPKKFYKHSYGTNMTKIHSHVGWGTRLALGKVTVPELRNRFPPEDVIRMINYAADYVRVDEEMKQMLAEGGSIWQ
jgi:hypothetical protein